MTRRCTSWIRHVRSAGTRISMSPPASAPAIAPPSRPVSATTRSAALVRRVNRAHDVLRVARRRDREQHVGRLAERAHLLREDLDERVVVGDRRQRRAVGRERDGRQAGALELEAIQELAREVLRVGGRAAVAAAQILPSSSRQRVIIAAAAEIAGASDDRGLLGRDALLKVPSYSFFHGSSAGAAVRRHCAANVAAVQLASNAFLIQRDRGRRPCRSRRTRRRRSGSARRAIRAWRIRKCRVAWTMRARLCAVRCSRPRSVSAPLPRARTSTITSCDRRGRRGRARRAGSGSRARATASP